MAHIKSNFPELAQENKWSLGQVMDKGDISDFTAARILRGETNFTIQTLEKLCVGFGVKPENILQLVED